MGDIVERLRYAPIAIEDAIEAAAEIERLRTIEAALRSFPKFYGAVTITPECVNKLSAEHTDMIISWAPIQTDIVFVDDDGNEFAILYEDGDPESGIPSGWCVPENADWKPAKHTALAAAKEEGRREGFQDGLSAAADYVGRVGEYGSDFMCSEIRALTQGAT